MIQCAVNEDEYWESVREHLENPPRPAGWEPEPEQGWLWLDDHIDDIEGAYGCKIGDLWEGDLMEIIDRYIPGKHEIISAEWSERVQGIKYTYRPEE